MSTNQSELFKIGRFTITTVGVTVNGTPTVEEWQQVLHVAGRARSGVQWAIGDLLAYGEERKFDEDAYAEAMEATGLKRGTLMNLKSISRAFPPGAASRSNLSWSHHALVAGFDEDERADLLSRAARENLSWEELRGIARAARQANRVQAQAWPKGTYGLIYANPVWSRDASLVEAEWDLRADCPPLTTDELSALAPQVQAAAAPSCVLYLWAPPEKVASGEAADVLRAWGFSGRTCMVWVQEFLGPGVWTRRRHDLLLIATRGNPVPPSEDERPDSVIEEDRLPAHAKPAEVEELLEGLFPLVPKLAMFTTAERHGWTAWGYESVNRRADSRAVRIREAEVAV